MDKEIELLIEKDFLKKKVDNIFQEDNSALKPLKAQDAIIELANYLLGNNWYIVDSVGGDQANAIIVDEIKKKYKDVNKSDNNKLYNICTKIGFYALVIIGLILFSLGISAICLDLM